MAPQEGGVTRHVWLSPSCSNKNMPCRRSCQERWCGAVHDSVGYDAAKDVW